MTPLSQLLTYQFFVNALLGVLIISIAAGVVGTYVVTRRSVALSGGITHACFGGLGLGYWLGISPVAMAALVAVGASATVEWLSATQRMRHDSAIAVVWAMGMATGIFFVFITPGYVPELNGFLFGNVLTISQTDLLWFGGFTVLLLAFTFTYRRTLLAISFDADFAKVMHMPVNLVHTAMTIFTAVCIVLTIKLVGVMLLMSMMALPPVIAELWCRKFNHIMALSTVVCALCSVTGLWLSALIDVPASAFIVAALVVAYVVSRVITRALGAFK